MFARDDEEAQDSGEEACEDQADPDGEAAGAEEEHEGQVDFDGEALR
jgi:hypothetical protein